MVELQVLIEVVTQGYTAHKGTAVTLEDDGTVQLLFPGGSGRRVRFDYSELEKAVAILKKAPEA